jgi:hypothetical protein
MSQDSEYVTQSDLRYFALRNAGYTGPIDQDGHAVTSGDYARFLRDEAARRGENTSWFTGDDPPPAADHGHSSRGRVLLFAAAMFVVVFIVITHISHLHP